MCASVVDVSDAGQSDPNWGHFPFSDPVAGFENDHCRHRDWRNDQRISTNIERNVGSSLSFDGHYVQVGWIVTGERYRYGDASGVFRGPEPRSRWGAVELAARVSALDLTEAGLVGGEAQNMTAGLNWHVGSNVRFLVNYVHSEVDAVNPLDDRDVDVVQARLQFDF